MFNESDHINDVWPREKGLRTFVQESADATLRNIITKYCSALTTELSHLLQTLTEKQMTLEENFNKLISVLNTYNQSLALDKGFYLYVNYTTSFLAKESKI